MTNIIARQGENDVQQDTPSISQGSKVTLHFSLLFSDGAEIDTTRNGKPASFIVGDGSLLPGFEEVLMGQRVGYAAQILIPAGDAFGERNTANVQLIERERFQKMVGDQPLEEGLVVSFQAPEGELPGVVQAVYEKTVKVDFNHPLSGRDITFDVAVLKVSK